MVNTGYRQSLYWGNETNYGSAAVINQPIGLVQSVNPTENNNLIKVRTLGGTRDYSNIVAGKFEVSGSFEYMLQGAAMLRQCIGEDTASTATVDSGPKFHTGATGTAARSYLHILGSANSPLVGAYPSFSLEFTDYEDSGATATTANLKRTFTGCRVNQATISASVDEPVKVSVDWQAQGVTIGTGAPSSVTEATVDPYVFYQGAIYATSSSIGRYQAVDKTSIIAEVNSFDWSVNNNLEAAWYVSGTTNAYQTKRTLKHLIPKGRDYTGSLNLHFKDRRMYQRFLGATTATKSQDTLTPYTVVIDFVRSGTIGGTKVDSDDYIRFIMPQTKFLDINITGNPEDVVGQTINLSITKTKIFVVDRDANYKL